MEYSRSLKTQIGSGSAYSNFFEKPENRGKGTFENSISCIYFCIPTYSGPMVCTHINLNMYLRLYQVYRHYRVPMKYYNQSRGGNAARGTLGVGVAIRMNVFREN